MVEQNLSNATIGQQDHGTGLGEGEDADPVSAGFIGAGDTFASQYHTCSLSANWTDNQVTISTGMAMIDVSTTISVQTDPGSGDSYDRTWHETISVPVSIPATTINLESGSNDIYLTVNMTEPNGVSVEWGTSVSPGTPSLQLGVADTSDESLSTLNDVPDTEHGTINAVEINIGGDEAATKAWIFDGNISHSDLMNVNSDDHHTRYTDAEAENAIETGTLNSIAGANNHALHFDSDVSWAEFKTDGSRGDMVLNRVYLDDEGVWLGGHHDNLNGSTRTNAHHSRYTDTEARSAVDGSSVSVSHDNLSGVSSNDHHNKYTDNEARGAVNGSSVSITGNAATADNADSVDGYDIQKNGTDGAGVINFKT